MTVRTDDAYDLWLNQVCESENTTYRYNQDIARFEKWAEKHGVNAKDIPVRWRNAKYADKQVEREKFQDEIKDLLSGYFSYLKKYGYTDFSVNRSMAVVQSFLHYYDIPFHAIKIKHPCVVYHNRDITKDEILTILNNSGVRNRAIYLVLYETGMRPWTVVNLKWWHIKDDFMAKRVPMKIKLTSDILKCGVSDRFVFIGENGYRALSNYLMKRHLPLKDDDFVFVTDKPFGNRIGINSISQAFNTIVKNLKLAETRGKKPKELRLYTLKKAFSKFMAIHVDRVYVEYWLGRTCTQTHYVSSDLEYHRALYAKGYPDLQLEASQVPANIADELLKKDQEIRALTAQLQSLQENARGYDELKKNYEQMAEEQKEMRDWRENLNFKISQIADGRSTETIIRIPKPSKTVKVERLPKRSQTDETVKIIKTLNADVHFTLPKKQRAEREKEAP